jgi:hypothetical protein
VRFEPDETSRLIAESVERSLRKSATDTTVCGRALAELDLLAIDLREPDALIHAGAASQVLGQLNAHFSLADQLVAAAVLGAAGDELGALRSAVLAGEPLVSVGRRTAPGRAVVTVHAEPEAFVVGDGDGSWLMLSSDQLIARRLGFFNPEAPQMLIEWDSNNQPLASVQVPQLYEKDLVLHAAELLGAASEMFRRTVDYVKERVQFGQPIGSFQALQHKLADDFALINAAEGVLLYALWVAGQPSVGCDSIRAWACAAQAMTADYGFKVMKDSIQLHGGVAATEELWVHRWARRVARLAMYQGTATQHYEELGRKLRAGVQLTVGGD